MKVPDYEPTIIPEGVYTFNLTKEPMARRKTSEKTGKPYVIVEFSFKATDDNDKSFNYSERIPTWEDEYRQVLEVLGAEKGADGKVHLSESIDDDVIYSTSFKASIVYKPDRKDPQKKWARLSNIQAGSVDEDEDLVPF